MPQETIKNHMALPPGVVANDTYESRVPEPPPVAINLPSFYDNSNNRPGTPQRELPSSDRHQFSSFKDGPTRTVSPNPAMASAVGLTPAQVYKITGNRQIEAPKDSAERWKYGMRYQAQCVLNHIYLGPHTAARDTQFLIDAGITMLLVVRDTRLVMANLLDMSKVAQVHSLALNTIDVTNRAELIQALPRAVKTINDHMLGAPRDKKGLSTGRVLVLCETGNGRSACVVVAYIMAMYGLHPADALAFVNHKRFCMSLDEDDKNMILYYGDILLAQSDVARHMHTDDGSRDGLQTGDSAGAPVISQNLPPSLSPLGPSRRPKRCIEDTMEMDETPNGDTGGQTSTGVTDMDPTLDSERFQDRSAFTPFADTAMK